MQIAIDGPSGAGKSTIAKQLAAQLGFIYVDTGALYRAIGYHAIITGVDPKDEEAVCSLLGEVKIELCYRDGVQLVLINGKDVSGFIRSEQASMAASDVSRYPRVRSFLLDLQRDIANSNDVIMDGRDIGTVILPNADLKVFLTADAAERARRRVEQLEQKGETVSFEDVYRDILARDAQDSGRETAPLKAADDAVTVDSTDYDLEQTTAIIADLIKERK